MKETLLRTGFPSDDPRCLPFVLDVDGEREWWHPAIAFPDRPAHEQGTLCAAAYLERQQMRGPSEGSLCMIVEAMPAKHTLAEIYFLRFIEICMHRTIGGRNIHHAAYAQALIRGEREAEASMKADPVPEGPTYEEVLALCGAFGCTARDLIAGDSAYNGGAL